MTKDAARSKKDVQVLHPGEVTNLGWDRPDDLVAIEDPAVKVREICMFIWVVSGKHDAV